MSRPWIDLRVATYNIHRSRGLDRRTRPERIAEVIASIDADVVALQEVIGPGLDSAGHLEEIGAALGMGWIMAPARELRRHQFGNAVLSRYPIREHSSHDLSWKTCEPRCGQRVAVDVGGHGLLQVYNVHLGTALLERRHQAPRVAGWVHDRRVSGPKILLGDFNEWSPRGIVAASLEHRQDFRDALRARAAIEAARSVDVIGDDAEIHPLVGVACRRISHGPGRPAASARRM